MSKVCVYCNVPLVKNVNKTKDHVPPKCFWGGLKPDNLITVPSSGASNDDIYTFLHHTMHHDVPDKRVAELLGSFGKMTSHNKNLTKQILSNCVDVPVAINGFKVDTKHLVTPQWKRMEAVMERTARGLVYHHHEVVFDNENTVIQTFAIDCIKSLPRETQNLIKLIIEKSEKFKLTENFMYSTFELEGNYIVFMVVNKAIEYVSFFQDKETEKQHIDTKKRKARNKRKASRKKRLR